ncbi:MAG: hypothetical protein PHV59_01705 [Victivallales bacterium]|nr:hypothetical protein [Victivallales bacterium]
MNKKIFCLLALIFFLLPGCGRNTAEKEKQTLSKPLTEKSVVRCNFCGYEGEFGTFKKSDHKECVFCPNCKRPLLVKGLPRKIEQ